MLEIKLFFVRAWWKIRYFFIGIGDKFNGVQKRGCYSYWDDVRGGECYQSVGLYKLSRREKFSLKEDLKKLDREMKLFPQPTTYELFKDDIKENSGKVYLHIISSGHFYYQGMLDEWPGYADFKKMSEHDESGDLKPLLFK